MLIRSLHLAGSTKCQGQEYMREIIRNGHTLQAENLYLVREPQNPFDANAVQVWYDDNGKKTRLGFVQRDQAPDIAECMDNGGSACAIDVTVCGTADTNYGMYFRVQMTYPYDFADLDLNSYPDESIHNTSMIYPRDYDLLDGDDDPEPPYLYMPDIPEDCDWDVLPSI